MTDVSDLIEMNKKPRIAKVYTVTATYAKTQPPSVYYVKHYSEKDASSYIVGIMPYMKIVESKECDHQVKMPWPFNFWLPDIEGGEEAWSCWDWHKAQGKTDEELRKELDDAVG